MKTLANCTPTEFMTQTVKIEEAVSEWLDVTKFLEIRGTEPAGIIRITKKMSEEEKETAEKNNKEKYSAQIKENLKKMFKAIFKENPEKTLNVLAMICFVEPENINDYTMSDYFGALNDVIDDENVRSFFSSLVRLTNGNI